MGRTPPRCELGDTFPGDTPSALLSGTFSLEECFPVSLGQHKDSQPQRERLWKHHYGARGSEYLCSGNNSCQNQGDRIDSSLILCCFRTSKNLKCTGLISLNDLLLYNNHAVF